MTRLLLVEDDHDLRSVVADSLTDSGYDVQAVADGLEALDALRETPPALVLLDLMLPRMSGWAFLEACRADSTLKRPPVVVLSSIRAINDYAQSLGVDAYLAKPFDADVLLDAISDVLARYEPADTHRPR